MPVQEQIPVEEQTTVDLDAIKMLQEKTAEALEELERAKRLHKQHRLFNGTWYVRMLRNKVKELQARKDSYRAVSVQAIADAGYYGFGTMDGVWYCIDHAVDKLFGGNYSAPLLLALDESDDLRDAQGHHVQAWHDDSMQFESDPRRLTKHGIYCQKRGCDAAILEKESKW